MYPWQQAHSLGSYFHFNTAILWNTKVLHILETCSVCVVCVWGGVWGCMCGCVGVKQQLHTIQQGSDRGSTFSLVEVFPLHSHQISGGELVIH